VAGVASEGSATHTFRLRADLRPLVETWTGRFAANNLLTYASAIALQLLVALAALIFLAVALLHPLHETHVWSRTIAPGLSSRLSIEWMGAFVWSVQREMRSTSPALIAFGSVVSIWEVSGAVRAIMGALNRIYGVDERRGFVRRFGVSFALAVAVAVLLIAAAFAGGGALEPRIPVVGVAERVLVPALMIYAVVALLVYVAPARRQPWRWASGGSVLIVVAWLLVSVAYAYWLADVVDLRTPEGTLALILSTVGYLYASAIAFLVGAQLDQLLREGGIRAALGGGRG
jgi:membrane protein